MLEMVEVAAHPPERFESVLEPEPFEKLAAGIAHARELERAPDGMKMKELSRRMMVTSGNITGITDQLVAEGLVERINVEGDRRAWRVRLTPRGRKLFNEMAQQHEDWIVEAFAGLSAKEIAQLHKLLGKVKQHSHNQLLMAETE